MVSLHFLQGFVDHSSGIPALTPKSLGIRWSEGVPGIEPSLNKVPRQLDRQSLFWHTSLFWHFPDIPK